jgi:hypothetical protein
MENVSHDFKVDDGFNILKLKVKEADKDGSLKYISSTYDPYDQMIRDGYYEGGRKIISMNGVLQHGIFPLPEILQMSMKYGAESMRRPVEIEFACNVNDDRTGEFYLLQIRPIVDSKQVLDEDLGSIPDEKCLLRSHNSLGHGISEDVVDVVYVKADEDFSAVNNPAIADEIERINRKFIDEGKNYVLIGPGRWGSSDYWLGIPVKWPHISAARLIVETAAQGKAIEPSQGTHFFQNLTSMGVGYFTIDGTDDDNWLDSDYLSAIEPTYESEFLRVVRFDEQLPIAINGPRGYGIVLKPGVELNSQSGNDDDEY